MFERFTDRARRVVVLAQQESRLLDHAYIGPEHILLGLLGEGEGVAAKALNQLELTLDGARRIVTSTIGRGSGVPEGHIPFTPQAKKALEFALREALQLGHNYIGTEHVLLGLIREGDGLDKLNLNRDAMRVQVMALLMAPYKTPVTESPLLQVQMDSDDLIAMVCDILADRKVQVVIATSILARLREQGAAAKAG